MKAILRGQLPAAPVSPAPAPHGDPGLRVRVLFVCRANACRSPMAEAFANHHGGDVVRADSAGLHPAPRLAAATAAVMREKGLEVAARRPRSFGRFPPERYDLIVNLSGSMLPNPGPAPVLNLEVPDPAGRDEEFFRQVRDRIEKQVTRLVSELRSACLRHAQRALAAPATLSPKAAVPR